MKLVILSFFDELNFAIETMKNLNSNPVFWCHRNDSVQFTKKSNHKAHAYSISVSDLSGKCVKSNRIQIIIRCDIYLLDAYPSGCNSFNEYVDSFLF